LRSSRTVEIVKRLLVPGNDPCKKQGKIAHHVFAADHEWTLGTTLFTDFFLKRESGGYFASGAMPLLNITQ
jgi:hypothetical protein